MPTSAQHFILENIPRPPEIIKNGLLVPETWMMILGDEGTRKTWLSLELGWAVSQGKPFLNYDTNKNKVLLINAELPAFEYQKRMRIMFRTRGIAPGALHVENSTVKLSDAVGYSTLNNWMGETGAKCVVIDNLYSSFLGSLNNDEVVQRFIDNVRRLGKEHQAGFVFVHHTRKHNVHQGRKVDVGVEDSTGHKFLTNSAVTIFHISNLKLKGGKDAIKVDPRKHNLSESPISTQLFQIDGTVFKKTNI